MKRTWKHSVVLGAAVAAITALTCALPVRAEFGDVVMNRTSEKNGMRSVVFPHWFHRMRYSCKACHSDLAIAFKAGGNDISMAAIGEGKACGACHNGTAAWGLDRCDLCHSGKPGAPVQVHLSTLENPGALPAAGADPNAFNRLFIPITQHNLPPAEDGIHDPESPGTKQLQAPRTAFQALPAASWLGRVDWAKALEGGKMRLLWDAKDPKAEATLFDAEIVREVKGSMPDVIFPHKKHTAVLDCTSCHPTIFEMQKGASKMSMAAINRGESCGACHGRVAFPATECRLCHTKPKAVAGKKP